MNTKVIIRPIHPGEEVAACSVVARSFDMFVGREYTPDGVAEFYRYVTPVAMSVRLGSGHFALVALLEEEVVGIIEVRNDKHISLLFVDPGHMKRGISRLLFDAAISRVRMDAPATEVMTVNSSRYAVPVYESFGFRVSGPENTIKGITYIPMSITL